MAIVQTITTHGEFADAFQRCGRGEQFSYSALRALFDFYDDFSEDVELDPIAICFDWSEYDSCTNAAQDLSDWTPSHDDDEDGEEDEAAAEEYLSDRTTILRTGSGTFVVASF